jgi:two-component system sensor histidine kinase ChvG
MATVDNEVRAPSTGTRWSVALRRRLTLAGRRLLRAISSRAASSLTRRIVVPTSPDLSRCLSAFSISTSSARG